MLISILAMLTPTVEQSRHIGTTRITARGSDQLSYCAASTRNTSTTASVNAYIAVEPVCCCKSASSVHSDRMACGSLGSTSCSIASIAWPELTPGAGFRLIVADGYRLYRMIITGPLTSRILATDPNGTIAPALVPHPQSRQVVDLLAEVGLTLHIDLPGAPEPVEVVDVQRPQVDLQRVEQLGDRNPRQLGLVAVDVEVEPRRVGPKAREEPVKHLRVCRSSRFLDDAVGDRLDFVRPQVAAVLDDDLESAGGSQPVDRRRVEDVDQPVPDLLLELVLKLRGDYRAR